MRRNREVQQRREAQKDAVRVNRTAAQEAAAGTLADTAAGHTAGASDPMTGDWQPFGLLDFTTFEEGFRLA